MSNDSRVHRFIVFAFSVLIFWGLLLAKSAAQEQEVAAAGKILFDDNCMVCHGNGGKGDGIMVTFSLLTVQPPDLTQLGSRNGGHFPFWKVYRMIDGREVVKGHGTQDMPLWGDEFRFEAGSSVDAQAQVRGKILQLVYYLQSLQTTTDAPAVKEKIATGQNVGR
jgi:mono/diheme cytochrome c family protein